MAKPFCSLPWSGLHINQELNVYYCCIMAQDGNQLGNLRNNTLEEILAGPAAVEVRQEFLQGKIPQRCKYACGTRTGDIVLDITADEKADIIENQRTQYQCIHSADIRSSNLCTMDCVYCSSMWSSTIAKRDNEPWLMIDADKMRNYQQYIDDIDLTKCRRLYLAGGEPLLMKEYISLLQQVLKHNPKCIVQVNTGLSTLNTPVYKLLNQLHNVSWIVSVDNTDPVQFEYIRHGNNWNNFLRNLETIQSNSAHTVNAHAVFFPLSYNNFDRTLQDLKRLGIKNIFIDPIAHDVLDFRNISHIIPDAIKKLESCLSKDLISQHTFNYLLNRMQETKTFSQSVYDYLETMDSKYNLNSREIFPELY